jgi:miniconductance mechanosensitive channel
MEPLRDWLVGLGWSQESAVAVAVAAAVAVAYLVGWCLRGLAKIPMSKYLKSSEPWREAIKERRVLPRISHVVTVIATTYMVEPLLEPWPRLQAGFATLLDALLVIAIAGAISALTGAAIDAFSRRDDRNGRLPLTALGQGLQIAVWTYAAVALLTVVSGKDVPAVLTGLTALGAVLVYIFRDPILGWTAGVQIAANDLVRHGDWISLPQRGVDGIVQDIALTTVKVRNWDKTISTVPSYSLVSEAFINWRGMFASGGRRIKRSVAIDANSVRFCDDELLDRLRGSRLFRDLEEGSAADFDPVSAGESGAESVEPGTDPLSDPRPTNLGCFRVWLKAWLDSHPMIHDDMTSLVRELESEGRGIPVEIYVFSNDNRWEHYESLQAEIFDHVIAVLPEFDLRVFQELTGEDLRSTPRTRDGAPEVLT